jgi:hypothetical protein
MKTSMKKKNSIEEVTWMEKKKNLTMKRETMKTTKMMTKMMMEMKTMREEEKGEKLD